MQQRLSQFAFLLAMSPLLVSIGLASPPGAAEQNSDTAI